MGYGKWATTNKDAIESTSAIVSAIGIALVAAGLWVSIISLNENKKATLAQTFFSIQRFGFEVAQEMSEKGNFDLYIEKGVQTEAPETVEVFLQHFSTILQAYNIIHFQKKLGYIDDPEWKLFKQEFCAIMRTNGADDYFQRHPIENSKYDKEFKKLTTACRI